MTAVEYKSLNDAAETTGLSDLEPGDTEIWYMRWDRKVEVIDKGKPTFLEASLAASGFFDGPAWCPDEKQLLHCFVKLGSIVCGNFERIFHIMQGEMWSPNGEARGLIRRRGLDHTSMSVGDIVKQNGVYYICRCNGWQGLKIETPEN